MICIFTLMARSLFKTLESMATPFSVKAYGKYLLPPLPMFEVPKWNLKPDSHPVPKLCVPWSPMIYGPGLHEIDLGMIPEYRHGLWGSGPYRVIRKGERIDGFTFNRLKPYDKWDTFRDEAKRLWKLYSNLVSPEISRVALRFINKFDIPLSPQSVLNFSEYLTAAPIVPEGLPQGVNSFLTRVVIQDPEMDTAAIILQAFEQIIDPRFLPVILDIDVFKKKESISEQEAWQSLEKLRHLKNDIFFRSITEKTKELFK